MDIKQAIMHRWGWIAGGILLLLVGLAIVRLRVLPGRYINALIAQEVVRLRTIFENIDATCGILGFDHDKNNIDFLNVVSFVSSEVGSMNLKHPQRWQGPYVQDNPTMQQKFYQIVKARDGYYVAPGDGVGLSNGYVVGKDLILDKDTDFSRLLSKGGQLRIRGKALAAKIRRGKTVQEIAEEKPVSIPPEIAVQVMNSNA